MKLTLLTKSNATGVLKLLLNFLLIISLNASAQSVSYLFNGTIKGENDKKNAFLYSSEYNLIKKVKVTNGKFNFSGDYHPSARPGDWPSGRIVVSDKDSIDSEDIRLLGRTVYFEPMVSIVYEGDKSVFAVLGGKENTLENRFLDNVNRLKCKSDSLYKPIEIQSITPEMKREKRRNIRLMLLNEMKRENLSIIRDHPNSAASMSNFMPYALTKSISSEEATTIFSSFTDEIKNTGYGKRTAELVAKLKGHEEIVYPTGPKLNLGDVMYDFTLNNIDGAAVRAADVFGYLYPDRFLGKLVYPMPAGNSKFKSCV